MAAQLVAHHNLKDSAAHHDERAATECRPYNYSVRTVGREAAANSDYLQNLFLLPGEPPRLLQQPALRAVSEVLLVDC